MAQIILPNYPFIIGKWRTYKLINTTVTWMGIPYPSPCCITNKFILYNIQYIIELYIAYSRSIHISFYHPIRQNIQSSEEIRIKLVLE